MPRLLKCGHSFCTACITCLLSSTPSTSTSAEAEQATCALRCPKCRTVPRVGVVDGEAAAAAGVKGLPRNFDLIDLLSQRPTPTTAESNCCEVAQLRNELKELKQFMKVWPLCLSIFSSLMVNQPLA